MNKFKSPPDSERNRQNETSKRGTNTNKSPDDKIEKTKKQSQFQYDLKSLDGNKKVFSRPLSTNMHSGLNETIDPSEMSIRDANLDGKFNFNINLDEAVFDLKQRIKQQYSTIKEYENWLNMIINIVHSGVGGIKDYIIPIQKVD
jgi:hypothetical protein